MRVQPQQGVSRLEPIKVRKPVVTINALHSIVEYSIIPYIMSSPQPCQ